MEHCWTETRIEKKRGGSRNIEKEKIEKLRISIVGKKRLADEFENFVD